MAMSANAGRTEAYKSVVIRTAAVPIRRDAETCAEALSRGQNMSFPP